MYIVRFWRRGSKYLCISLALCDIPRQVSNIIPTSETQTRKRVRVTNAHTAREGGSCALADFQVIPPLGRSIVKVVEIIFGTLRASTWALCRGDGNVVKRYKMQSIVLRQLNDCKYYLLSSSLVGGWRGWLLQCSSSALAADEGGTLAQRRSRHFWLHALPRVPYQEDLICQSPLCICCVSKANVTPGRQGTIEVSNYSFQTCYMDIE